MLIDMRVVTGSTPAASTLNSIGCEMKSRLVPTWCPPARVSRQTSEPHSQDTPMPKTPPWTAEDEQQAEAYCEAVSERQVYEAEMRRFNICIRCHRKRYAEHLCVLEASRQHDEYGPPCRCSDAPKMRSAFDVLDALAQDDPGTPRKA